MNGVIHILLQEFCLILNILICFGIPLGGLFLIKRKEKRLLKAFFTGMLAFLISQVFIRLPLLLYVLPNFFWFQILNTRLVLKALFYGFSAGIFEESARLIFMKLFLKENQSLYHGIAFGLGHGGIEAILFVGLSSLIYAISTPLNLLSLPSSTASLFLGGMERIFAITFHVGASLIVLHGIRANKIFLFTLCSIILHGILDSASLLLPAFFDWNSITLELFIMFFSIATLFFGIFLFITKNKKKEISL